MIPQQPIQTPATRGEIVAGRAPKDVKEYRTAAFRDSKKIEYHAVPAQNRPCLG